MFKKVALATLATSAIVFSMQASAAGHGHGYHKRDAQINKEQREQAVMIQQGIKTCQITPAEARTLRNTQSQINKLEGRFKANGLTPWESQTLLNKLHSARVQINKLTKNRDNCHSKYRSKDRRHGATPNGSQGHNRGKSSIKVTVRTF